MAGTSVSWDVCRAEMKATWPHHRTYVLDITDNLVVRIESAMPQIDVSLAHSLYFD